MSEASLWLDAALAGAIAFALTHSRNWRVVPAIFAATVTAVLLYLIVTIARDGRLDTFFLEAELLTIGSWSVILAGVGAAAGLACKQPRDRS